MSDIPALSLLNQQIKQFNGLPEPPDRLDDVEAYKNIVDKTLASGQREVLKVKTYVEKIDEKLKELRNAIQNTITQNQDAMRKILESFQPAQFVVFSPKALEKLKVVRELQEITKKLMIDRLNDFINETEEACAKCADGVALTVGDLDNLLGCLNSWKNVKEESYKEEERRRKEEQKRKEDEERRRREERERKKKEEEERKKREEEERKRREQEEAERKAEEERRRIEEEERLRKEAELRQKQEEEDRQKREEEERRRREAEERKRREEEAARRREEQRLQLEAEKKERERLKREAEERAFRQDPNNWKPVVYKRECDGEVDGRKAYHGGVSCIMASPPGGIEENDLQCTASDELDSVIDILDDEERPVSSLIDIKSTKEIILHSESPSRIYIPHYPALSLGDEIVVKVSINNSDWETTWPVTSTTNMAEHEKTIKRITGIEVNDFTTLKAIVICRPRCQSIIVDKPGVSVYSSMDRNLKLFVPREAYQKKTELRLSVKPITSDSLSGFVKEIPSLENILSVNSYVTLSCPRTASKTIELDFLKGSQNKGEGKRGKAYQLYTCGDKLWKFADVEYKGHQDDLSVSLPIGRHKYVVIEIEVPSSFPKDNVLKLVDDLYTCVNKTRVRMIVKQQAGGHQKCAVRIVKDDQWQDTTQSLAEKGYTEGPDLSAPFSIQEGQHVQMTVTGNLEANEETDDKIFLSYLGGVKANLTLKVKDTWKQKDLPAYVGNIKCCVLGEQGFITRIVEVTVSIPKLQRERTVIAFTPVRFPYYLTTLASFVSHNVCKEEDDIWQAFLKTLLGEEEFHSGYRLAKRKLTDDKPEEICMTMLLDWMKAQAAHEDKIYPVKRALQRQRLHNMADVCETFVNYHKEQLTDEVIKEIAARSTKEVRALGQDLELDSSEVDKCINEHPHNKEDQILALLTAWRESPNVVKYGVQALEYLKDVTV